MESNLSDRLLIRIAGKICDALMSREAGVYTRLTREIEHLVTELSSLQDVQKKLEMCVSRSWQAASRQLQRRIERITENLPYYVSEVDHAADMNGPSPVDVNQFATCVVANTPSAAPRHP